MIQWFRQCPVWFERQSLRVRDSERIIPPSISGRLRKTNCGVIFSELHPCSKWQWGRESGQFSGKGTHHSPQCPAEQAVYDWFFVYLLILYVHAWVEEQFYHTRGDQYQGMLNQSQIIHQVIEREYLYSMLQVKNIFFWSRGQERPWYGIQNSVWDVNGKKF